MTKLLIKQISKLCDWGSKNFKSSTPRSKKLEQKSCKKVKKMSTEYSIIKVCLIYQKSSNLNLLAETITTFL